MKIIDRRRSIEKCTESGWDAFDLMVDEPIDAEYVKRMRCIEGSFLFMSMLRQPFFKIESHNYVIKGVTGDDHFRMAVHKDYLSELDKVVDLLNGED